MFAISGHSWPTNPLWAAHLPFHPEAGGLDSQFNSILLRRESTCVTPCRPFMQGISLRGLSSTTHPRPPLLPYAKDRSARLWPERWIGCRLPAVSAAHRFTR